MYQLLKTYGRTPTGWKRIEIGHLTIATANYQFPTAQLFVQDEGDSTLQLDLSQLYARLNNLDRGWTINAWLAKQPNGAIEGTPELSDLARAGHVHVTDIWNYPVDVSIGNVNYGPGTKVPTIDQTDIVIKTRRPTDGYITRLSKRCMFTVNGRLMAPTRINDRLYLPNARRFMAETGEAIETVSVWDFTGVGEIEWVPLREEDLKPLPPKPHESARDIRRYRLVTPVDLGDTSVFLIIDGHPQLLSPAVDVFDTHTAILTVNARTCAEYVLDTPMRYRAPYTPMNVRGHGVDLNAFDPMGTLTSGYSGLLIIRNNDVSIFSRPVGRTDVPGVYTYPYPPTGILVDDTGRVRDYSVDGYDGDIASLSITGGLYYPKMDDTVIRDHLPVLSKTRKKPPTPIIVGGKMLNLYTLNKS